MLLWSNEASWSFTDKSNVTRVGLCWGILPWTRGWTLFFLYLAGDGSSVFHLVGTFPEHDISQTEVLVSVLVHNMHCLPAHR